jgi:uncharacterized Zn-binding protein involved in type VI secretion
MPAAARVGDAHRCDEEEPVTHAGGPIVTGARNVYVGGRHAARVGDGAHCEGGAEDLVVEGEPTVIVAGARAARRGDRTGGGRLVSGLDTVLIGPERRGRRRPRRGR